MREALKTNPIARVREFEEPLKHRGGPDRRVAIRVGRRLLGEAHATEHLNELGEIIAEEYPDARSIKPFIDDTGAIVTGWQWNFRTEGEVFGRPLLVNEEVSVGVWPISKVLKFGGNGFTGRTPTELMRETVWRKKHGYVLDAIRRAYEIVMQNYEIAEEMKKRVTTSK